MKTRNFLRSAGTGLMFMISMGLMAQGHHHGNGRDRGNGSNHHHGDQHNRGDQRDRGDRRTYTYGDHYAYNGHGHYSSNNRYTYTPTCDVHVYRPAPVVERRVVYYERPVRYVYYRDYDVYYDCHRNVYITFSGNHWTITNAIPVRMHDIDRDRIQRDEIDYRDDDFPSYLDRLRPKGEAYKDWAW